MQIYVYGMKIVCPSCVGAPSSFDTADWLSSALFRKYPNLNIVVSYIDVEKTQNNKAKGYLEKFESGELLYPLVEIKNEIVDEGIISLKKVSRFIENHS